MCFGAKWAYIIVFLMLEWPSSLETVTKSFPLCQLLLINFSIFVNILLFIQSYNVTIIYTKSFVVLKI